MVSIPWWIARTRQKKTAKKVIQYFEIKIESTKKSRVLTPTVFSNGQVWKCTEFWISLDSFRICCYTIRITPFASNFFFKFIFVFCFFGTGLLTQNRCPDGWNYRNVKPINYKAIRSYSAGYFTPKIRNFGKFFTF